MADEEPTISDVIAAAGKPGHAHAKAVLGEASAWLVMTANGRNLNLQGYRHTIDTASVRHIHAKHGDPNIEKSRGQIDISSDDIKFIPDVLASPDKVIFGVRSKRNHPFIGYLKRMADGSTFYVEEVRTGRKELAAVTLYKYPATRDARAIVANLRLDGRTDSGDEIFIADLQEKVTTIVLTNTKNPDTIDANTVAGTLGSNGRNDGGVPAGTLSAVNADSLESNGRTDSGNDQIIDSTQQRVTHPLLRRALHYLPPALGILVLSGIIFGLHRALKKVGLHDVLAALKATPGAEIAHALGLLGLSFGIMLVYDIPGILFAKKLVDFPRLGMRRIGLASFCAYALSHVVGAPALSAAAIRLRLYAQWGVPAAGIGRIVTLSGTAFALGTCTLLGGVLLFHPTEVPLLGNAVTPLALRGIGAALLVVIGIYVLAARKTAPLRVLGRNIPRPGWGLAIAQVALSCADTGTACAILFVVLPTIPGLTYPHVLAIYLAGFTGGLFSGLPGGVGVFDTVLLLGLTGYMDPARAIGAILLFRVLYYLVPAAIAGLCFAGHEIWITARRGHPGRAN